MLSLYDPASEEEYVLLTEPVDPAPLQQRPPRLKPLPNGIPAVYANHVIGKVTQLLDSCPADLRKQQLRRFRKNVLPKGDLKVILDAIDIA